tara:strand:+ start:1021 stop:2502 length:1482 start_codon:yes stop_codon:yes gene_type:complete
MVFQNNVLAGASNVTGEVIPDQYLINQSIRFNNTGSNGTSHYFSRTPSSAGNQKTWTLSWWMKVGVGSDRRSLFSRRVGSAGAAAFRIRLLEDSSGNASQIDFYMGNGSSVDAQTFSYKFRDPSAWYHCVVTFDTTNVSVEDRLKFTVNGVRQTDTTAYANLDYDTNYVWNSANEHNIGRQVVDNDNWMDGYMAEIVFIDGTAHEATSFGEYNSKGIWIPKNIYNQSFTFGTNGFYLTGQNADYLGYDYQTSDRSGTTNDWTANNFNAHDKVADSPTNNFCVMNPNNNSGSGTLSQGNLRYAGASTGNNVAGTIGMSSDKWYWELYIEDDNQVYPGVQDSNVLASGYTEKAVGVETGDNGDIHEDDANSGLDSVDPNTGDIVGIAFDATNKKIWWSLNGVWYRADQSTTAVINVSEVEAGNQGYNLSSRTPDFFMPFIGNYTHGTAIINFGQEGTFAGATTAGGNSDGNGIGNFKYSVPSGYLALCTKNLGES